MAEFMQTGLLARFVDVLAKAGEATPENIMVFREMTWTLCHLCVTTDKHTLGLILESGYFEVCEGILRETVDEELLENVLSVQLDDMGAGQSRRHQYRGPRPARSQRALFCHYRSAQHQATTPFHRAAD